MKVTLFFGSLMANHVLAVAHCQVPGRFDHAHAYKPDTEHSRSSSSPQHPAALRPTGVAVSVKTDRSRP